jgi:hypothetical protein
VVFLQLLSQGSRDVPTLLAEVTLVQEATTATEVTRVMAVHGAKTSTQEVVAAWDSGTLRVKDVDDWATMSKRQA